MQSLSTLATSVSLLHLINVMGGQEFRMVHLHVFFKSPIPHSTVLTLLQLQNLDHSLVHLWTL